MMEHIIVIRMRRRRDGARQRKATQSLHRSLRDMSNPFHDANFRALYRLTPDMALGVVAELKPYYPQSSYANAIPIELKGSYQRPDGKDANVSLSQASVSRTVSQTTDALNTALVLRKWIKFPCDLNERQQIVQRNYRKFHMPGVLGYLDGTHILLKKPCVHEELFVNRKGQHSLNIQVVCDSNLEILNIVSRFPGSTHDAYVWRASIVRDVMMSFRSSCWLLGDSGYPLEPWLLTPVLNAREGSPEANYTQIHIKSRNSVERCFGLLKGRFRCLHKHRVLEYAPTKAGRIATACAVLHNICIKGGLEEVEVEDEITSVDVHDPTENAEPLNSDLYNLGLQVRTNLINRL